MGQIAFADVRELFHEDGTLKAVHELDDNTAHALAGVEIFEEYEGSGKNRRLIGYTRKYRFSDRLRALQVLAQHFGITEVPSVDENEFHLHIHDHRKLDELYPLRPVTGAKATVVKGGTTSRSHIKRN